MCPRRGRPAVGRGDPPDRPRRGRDQDGTVAGRVRRPRREDRRSRRRGHRRAAAGRPGTGRGAAVGAAARNDGHRSSHARGGPLRPTATRSSDRGRPARRRRGDASPGGATRSGPSSGDPGGSGAATAWMGRIPPRVHRAVGTRNGRAGPRRAERAGVPGRLPGINPPRPDGIHRPGSAARAASAAVRAGRVRRSGPRRRADRTAARR